MIIIVGRRDIGLLYLLSEHGVVRFGHVSRRRCAECERAHKSFDLGWIAETVVLEGDESSELCVRGRVALGGANKDCDLLADVASCGVDSVRLVVPVAEIDL